MRIAVVTETYAPEINGVALTVQSYVENLIALGHQVLLTRPRPQSTTTQSIQTPFANSFAGAHDINSQTTSLANIGSASENRLIESFVRAGKVPRYSGIQFGMPSFQSLKKLWVMHRPDVIYVATEGPLGWAAISVAKKLGIPISTGFHTRFDDFVAHYGAKFLSPLVFRLMRKFHNDGAATIVPTRELANFLSSKGFTKVRHLARAVDCHRFHPNNREESLRASWGLRQNQLAIIHVGRIAAEKNLALLARSVRAIQTVCTDARCIIVGDGPALPGLKEKHPDWIFCGMQRGQNLAQHFACGDLFLFPSMTETFGNVTLEAMASGVATIAFNYGAANEYMVDGRSGVCIPFGNEDVFVEASVSLALKLEHRKYLALNAYESVQKLSPKNVASDLVELMLSLQQKRAA